MSQTINLSSKSRGGCFRKTSHPKSKEDGQGWEETEVADTLNTLDNSEVRTPILILENHPNDSRVKIREDNVFQTLSSRMGTGGGNVPMVMEMNEAKVRRLTPLECERLQGYPDHWTDIGDWVDSKGKKHKGDSDAPRFKALGNSIATPFWEWMAERICKQYDRPIEMASLFDGIGGFPLVFERHGAKAVWASEIEEFPIAVTKKRFPDENRSD